mgnify:CR=1 FL=1
MIVTQMTSESTNSSSQRRNLREETWSLELVQIKFVEPELWKISCNHIIHIFPFRMLAKPSFYSTILTTAISCVAEGISDTKCDVKDTGELKTRVAPDYTDMHLIDEGILRKLQCERHWKCGQNWFSWNLIMIGLVQRKVNGVITGGAKLRMEILGYSMPGISSYCLRLYGDYFHCESSKARKDMLCWEKKKKLLISTGFCATRRKNNSMRNALSFFDRTTTSHVSYVQ